MKTEVFRLKVKVTLEEHEIVDIRASRHCSLVFVYGGSTNAVLIVGVQPGATDQDHPHVCFECAGKEYNYYFYRESPEHVPKWYTSKLNH